jgi:hypothetical protein
MISASDVALAEEFYTANLPAPRRAEFLKALRITGLAGEIALMRFRIRDLAAPGKNDHHLYLQANKLLASMINVQNHFSGTAGRAALSSAQLSSFLDTLTGDGVSPHRKSPGNSLPAVPPVPIPPSSNGPALTSGCVPVNSGSPVLPEENNAPPLSVNSNESSGNNEKPDHTGEEPAVNSRLTTPDFQLHSSPPLRPYAKKVSTVVPFFKKKKHKKH